MAIIKSPLEVFTEKEFENDSLMHSKYLLLRSYSFKDYTKFSHS